MTLIKTTTNKMFFLNSSQLIDVFTLLILLKIGNIESNPGPTAANISFRKIETTIPACNGKDNVTHLKSRWGQLAIKLDLPNSLDFRRFLMNFVDIFPLLNNEKYMDTSITSINQAVLIVNETFQLTTNQLTPNFSPEHSTWGKLCLVLYSTNSFFDRQFVANLWSISSKVIGDPIPEFAKLMNINNVPIKVQTAKKRKRRYQKSHFKNQPNQPKKPKKMKPQSEADKPQTPTNTDEITKSFNESVWQFPIFPCQVCDQLIYPKLKKQFKVTELIQQLFFALDNNQERIEPILSVCSRCNDHLQKGNIPPKSKRNSLSLQPIPSEIQILNTAETRLISQVKAYMKIFLTCKGRGQKAMKGMVIHFPQKVTELIKQLPLSASNSDIILVTETSDRALHPKEFQVHPKSIHNALLWLSRNNLFYKDIVIKDSLDFEGFQSLRVSGPRVISNPETLDYGLGQIGYQELTTTSSVLRASMHQGHPMFGLNAGMQCTAMSAAFLGHSFVDSPVQWTKEILDRVLICGDGLYTEKRRTLNIPNQYLEAAEMVGNLTVFGGIEINLEINMGALPELNGFLQIVKGNDFGRLYGKIGDFILGEDNFCIITTNSYSMAIHKTNDFVYYFDSHSRGLKGCAAPITGTAVVLKYNISEAAQRISSLINRNCTPGDCQPINPLDYAFQITPFRISTVQELEDISTNIPSSSSHFIPPSTVRRQIQIDSESDSEQDYEADNQPLCNEILQDFGKVHNFDCVIDRQDFLEPHIEEMLNVDLVRECRSPISDHIEKDLDLLAFTHLFPYGVNGLNQLRKYKLTPLDYFQQRLMSSDQRFAGNTDFLFYALSVTDTNRMKEKVSICCAMKRQGDNPANPDASNVFEELGIRDAHVYMSSVRGSSSYWKQYTGDVLAMIKQLGIPGFFFTFSFDDLNSIDCVNALWKAKYGASTPDIKPEDIPYEDRKTLLNDFPIIAAKHFSMRLTKVIALLKSRSMDIFGRHLVDFTFRVEFQARGSPHCHSLLWFENSPAWDSPEGIAFLEQNVSCSLTTSNSDLVLKYQRHRHTKTCFKNKNRVCRFAFPKASRIETRIFDDDEIHSNRGKFFELKRQEDESMVNYYHPILLKVLKCNIDIQPVTGANAVAYYIGKYMSKAEPSEIRPEIQEAIKNIQNSNLPYNIKMIQQGHIIMRCREVCAQEAAFRLCHLYLKKSSRSTVFLPTFKKENRIRMLKKETFMNEVPEFCMNIIDRYMTRPPILESLCLFEFAAYWTPVKMQNPPNDDEDVQEFPDEPENESVGNVVLYLQNNKGAIKKRSRPAIVKYPNFHPMTDKDSYHYSLILMYLPFRIENFCDGRSSVQVFTEKHSQFRKFTDDPIIRLELVSEIDRALLREADFDNELPNQDSEIDNHSFTVDYVQRQDDGDIVAPEDMFPPPNLHESQTIVEQIRKIRSTLTPEQLFVFEKTKHMVENPIVDGIKQSHRWFVSSEGGCGKTYLINLLSLYLRNYLSNDSVLVAAPTGKAAMLLPNGNTLHSSFSLPIELDSIGKYNKLGGKKLSEFRNLYRNLKFILIDETSMISYQVLRMMHNRLCEIFGNDELFGGINVFLFGDLYQLPPCRGDLIFRKPAHLIAEVDLWRQFQFHELKVNMRQGQNDPLIKILGRLRKGKLDLEDLKVLQTRILNPLNQQDAKEKAEKFKDAIRIFPTNRQCDLYNSERSKDLKTKTTVYTINAYDTYADGIHFGKKCDLQFIHNKDSKTGGIVSTLQLGIGSRVLLRRNLNVKKGLVNGALGIVRAIRWTVDPDRQLTIGALPKEVLIQFDHLEDPKWIKCVTVEFGGKKNQRVSRLMIPFILSWALTIHKIQGASLDLCVVDIGPKLFAKGMAYTALSRVRTMGGLLITSLAVNKLITTDKFSPANLLVYDEYKRLKGYIMVPRK